MAYSIPIEQDITITSGDDATFAVTIGNSDGSTALDLSAYDVFFTVKRSKNEYDSDATAIYQVTTSSVTISASGTPTSTSISIPYHAREAASSTATPLQAGTYYYDIQLVAPSGNPIQTWWKGKFVVTWHATVTV